MPYMIRRLVEIDLALLSRTNEQVMSGEEFASVVRGYSRFANIPILFLTAWETPARFG